APALGGGCGAGRLHFPAAARPPAAQLRRAALRQCLPLAHRTRRAGCGHAGAALAAVSHPRQPARRLSPNRAARAVGQGGASALARSLIGEAREHSRKEAVCPVETTEETRRMPLTTRL